MTGPTDTGPPEWAAPEPGRPTPDGPAPAAPPPPPSSPPTGGWPPGQPAGPKPGIVALRPLTVTDILDGAVTYIRTNPVATLGLSAVVITITQLIQLPISTYLLAELGRAAANPTSLDSLVSALWATLAGAALGGFITFIATTALTGLLIVVLGHAVLGRRTSLGAAWAAARGRVPGLLGLVLLTSLALLAVMAVAIAPGVIVAVSGGSGVAVTVIGVIVGICAVVFLGVSWSMATPAYVLERIPVMAAFGRSSRLVRPQWWRIFGILLLGGIITAIVAFVLSLPFGFAANLLGAGADPATGAVTSGGVVASVVTAVGTIVSGTVTAPLSAGITGLLYIDQRMRREALDLELARAAQSPDAPLPGPPGTAPPNPAG